jgi:nitronate monooxygenase
MPNGAQHWPDRRVLDLLGIEIPIIQAPMAGADTVALARAVSGAGGLGSLACALLGPEQMRAAAHALCDGLARPFNLNFFCHTMSAPDAAVIERWKTFLRPHYAHFGLDIDAVAPSRLRMPFDAEACAVVEEIAPAVASFHFGLPEQHFVERLKRRGIKIVSSATSVREAEWLEARGCGAIIAQGAEAGGHRAMFLETNPNTQTGLFALLPQIVDAVRVPVIAAGGIADGRAIAAAFALGASAVQLGTAYLLCPEASISPLHRQAIQESRNHETALTNLFSGRPARGIVNRFMRESQFISDAAPPFPHAASLVAPLRAASEKARSIDYMQLWAGQAAHLAQPIPAAELTRRLAAEAQ